MLSGARVWQYNIPLSFYTTLTSRFSFFPVVRIVTCAGSTVDRTGVNQCVRGKDGRTDGVSMISSRSAMTGGEEGARGYRRWR